MLKKKERLSRKEFNRFFSLGRKLHSHSLLLVYSPLKVFYTGVVVSKKVARSAVKRNLLRRRVYEIIDSYKKEQSVTGVFIVIMKPAAATQSFQTLREEVITLLGSIKKAR